MLEHASSTVDHPQTSPSLAPSRAYFAWAMLAAMLIPGHTQHSSCAPRTSLSQRQAPHLTEIPRNSDLMGKSFCIGEDGLEACLDVESGHLVLTINGEKFIVQKICTDEGISLDLTPMCVSACRSLATITSDGDAIVGRVALPFLKTAETRMEQEEMLKLSRAIAAKSARRGSAEFLVEWKNEQGRYMGSAVLTRFAQMTQVASR